MAEADNGKAEKRYAVVTGGNKGIGFEICRQLVAQGIVVVLTARDEKRGLTALEQLKGSTNFSDHLLFHQLDVADSSSVASLAEFIKTQFERLDILVNNAGVLGMNDEDILRAVDLAAHEGVAIPDKWKKEGIQKYELAVECLQINYYGAKRMVEACLPLLQLSPSPRIVNVSSYLAVLKYIPSEWVKGILNNENNLKEDTVDELLNQFLEDFKEGSLEAKGWPLIFSAYTVSKAAMNAYTRILAKKHPNIKVNCVSPGYVKTDITNNAGALTVEEGAESPVRLALLPDDCPSGLFFHRKEVSSFV